MARKRLLAAMCLAAVFFCASLSGCLGPKKDGKKPDFPDYTPPPIEVPSTLGPYHGSTPDSGTPAPFNLVQSIPPTGAFGLNPNMAISFFFDDEIPMATVGDNSVFITAGGKRITGTFTGVLTPAGFTCLSFIPYEPFPYGTRVTLYIPKYSGGLLDDDGSQISSTRKVEFGTIAVPIPSADGNLSFESGTTGFNCSGDCIVKGASYGGIDATDGSAMAFISTGQIVSDTPAISGTTSLISSGPITVTGTQLVFDYKFISAEFMDYYGSPFDDSFLVSIVGTSGQFYSNLTDSVNLTNTATLFATAVPGMPDDGDSYAGETPWITKTIDVSALGPTVNVTFFVSDVGDKVFSTVVVIDNIHFLP